MCATCVSGSDAPPVAALITAIKRELRRQRQIKWVSRAVAAVAGVLACYFTWIMFQGGMFMVVFVIIDILTAWVMLRVAEEAAERADHTKEHLRLTEALESEPG